MIPPLSSDATGAKSDPRRFVIVHYHLFKNAGSSVDRALRTGSGGRWRSIEAANGESRLLPDQLRAAIHQDPETRVFSSHTAQIAPQDLGEDLHVLPVVFVRHPIDRVRSAYDFERRQGAETLGSRTARAHDFPTYVDFFLKHRGSRSFRNFHGVRLAPAGQPRDAAEHARARDAIDRLPFVGVVEHFAASIARLQTLIRAHDPHFVLGVAHENAGTREGSLDERLAQIRHDLGAALYEELWSANEADLALWTLACERLKQWTTAGNAPSG